MFSTCLLCGRYHTSVQESNSEQNLHWSGSGGTYTVVRKTDNQMSNNIKVDNKGYSGMTRTFSIGLPLVQE